MTWQILLGISIVTTSLSTILQRVLLKDVKSDPKAYAILFQLLTGVLIGIFSIIRGFTIVGLEKYAFNLIIITVLYGAGTLCIFHALKKISASEFTVIFASRALWTIITALIVLHEVFTINQIIGSFLIFISVVLVSWKVKHFKLGEGELYALAAAFLFGIAFVNDALILKKGFDVPSYLTITFILPGIAIAAFSYNSLPNIKVFLQRTLFFKMLLMCFVYAIAAITIFAAYQAGNNAAQIAPLNQTSIILTVLLGILFLGEKASLLKKLLGALLSMLGMILIK